MNHTIAVRQLCDYSYSQQRLIAIDITAYYESLWLIYSWIWLTVRLIPTCYGIKCIILYDYRIQSCTIIWWFEYNRTTIVEDQSQDCTRLTIQSFKMVIVVHRRYIINNCKMNWKRSSMIIIICTINLVHSYGIPYDATVWQYEIYCTIVQGLSYVCVICDCKKNNCSIVMKLQRLMPIRQFPYSWVTIFNHPLNVTGALTNTCGR